MKLLPMDRFRILSTLDKEEVISRLEEITARPQFIRFRRPGEPYEGTISDKGFRITPVLRYWNSFKPLILGTFYPHPDGTRIHVRQYLHVLVLLFTIAWLGMVLFIGSKLIWPSEAVIKGDPGAVTAMEALLLFLLLFVWALTTGGFWWEARHTREKLMSHLSV